MNQKLRYLLYAFIASSVGALAVLVYVHYSGKNTHTVAQPVGAGSGVTMDKVHYSGSKDGRLEWEITADSADRSKDSDVIKLKALKAVFYSKEGKPYAITAKEGWYRESTSEVDTTGDVSVESKDLFKLSTGHLNYSMKTREIRTDDPVRIITDRMEVTGVGLLIEVDKGRLVVLKKVRSIFKDKLG